MPHSMPGLATPARPLAGGRKAFLRPSAFTVLKKVDRYEDLVRPRVSSRRKAGAWSAATLVRGGVLPFFFVALCFVGLVRRLGATAARTGPVVPGGLP
jgi:hypothetical protein